MSSSCSERSNNESTSLLPTTSSTTGGNDKPATANALRAKEEDSTRPALFHKREASAFVNYRDSEQIVSSKQSLPQESSEMNKFAKSDSNSSFGSSSSSLMGRNEWQSRRKSYGFEKVTPPPEPTKNNVFQAKQTMESSTDSGIGRSGELVSQSAMPSKGTTTAKNGTIVHISNPSPENNYQSYRSSFRNSLSSSATKVDNLKRHSIAVADDRKYFNEDFKEVPSMNGPNRPLASANGFNVIFNSNNISSNNNNSLLTNPVQPNNPKRVEFCKTEVHFAAESGRVNIVDSDGKPPPTNNFRRRRSSTQFLPDSSEQVQPSSSAVAKPAEDVSGASKTLVTNSPAEPRIYSEEETDSLRGILKNKPVKPKPYHLGENCADGESLFGVRLRPVSSDCSNWTPPPRATTLDSNPSISLYKEPDSGDRTFGISRG